MSQNIPTSLNKDQCGPVTPMHKDTGAACDIPVAKSQQVSAETERLAALGRVTAKVAHELNNPLDGILRYMSLAIRQLEDAKMEKPLEYLLHCRRGLMRIVQVTGELLEYSRGNYAMYEFAQLDTILDEAVKTSLARAQAQAVEIQNHYSQCRAKIRGSNIYQVFCNIIKNALDAMPSGGRLSITAALISDAAVELTLQDTGPGINPENLDSIFEPFFTTKPPGFGTGLGLAICKDIVESHGGKISVANAPNGGCVFTLCLPVES